MSDLHFHHKRMPELCGRPDDYEERLIKALQGIPEKDTFICLGDIVIGDDLKVHEEIIMPLKCKKILIKGNHDTKSYTWYLEHGWDMVMESMILNIYGKTILFTHKPRKPVNCDINIHGHLHNKDVGKTYPNQVLVKMEHEYKAFDLQKLVHLGTPIPKSKWKTRYKKIKRKVQKFIRSKFQ